MVAASTLALGQSPEVQSAPVARTAETVAAGSMTPADWLVPIHASSDGRGPTERWAAGLDFKVRFGTGVEFFPVLGADAPTNLPLRWETESVRFEANAVKDAASDAEELTGGEPRVHAEDWRYELRHGAVTEVYDVGEAGVAQSFVVTQRGAERADLVVTGAITTALEARPRGAEHGPLQFFDAVGEEVLSYGAAFALDAGGRKLPITAAFDGARIELRVPSEWLATAEWPVTIDPLLARTTAGGGAFTAGASLNPAMAYDRVNDQYVLGYSRAVSGADRDLYVRVLDAQLNHLALILPVVFTTDHPRCAVAFAESSDRYVIAAESANVTDAWIGVYVHDANDLTPGSLYSGAPWSSGEYDRDPSLGGAGAGDLVYLAYRRDLAPANTSQSRVRGMTFDPVTHTFGAEVEHRSSAGLVSYDAEAPCVSPHTPGAGWMIVWQEFNHLNPSDDWDVVGHRVSSLGSVSGLGVFGPGGVAAQHKIAPSVAGASGDYAVTYMLRANDGTANLGDGQGRALEIERFHWQSWTTSKVSIETRTLAATFTPEFDVGGGQALAHDHETDSHWVAVWRRDDLDELHGTRVGYDLLAVEEFVVEASPFSGEYAAPVVCHNREDYEFAIGYGQNINFSQNPVAMRRLVMPNASTMLYARGCQGEIDFAAPGARDLPYPGLESFSIRLSAGRPFAPTALMMGFGPGATVLPLAPGCSLAFDLALPVHNVAQGATSASGAMFVNARIPSHVGPITLYWQFVQIDIAEAITSEAWSTTIGP